MCAFLFFHKPNSGGLFLYIFFFLCVCVSIVTILQIVIRKEKRMNAHGRRLSGEGSSRLDWFPTTAFIHVSTLFCNWTVPACDVECEMEWIEWRGENSFGVRDFFFFSTRRGIALTPFWPLVATVN